MAKANLYYQKTGPDSGKIFRILTRKMKQIIYRLLVNLCYVKFSSDRESGGQQNFKHPRTYNLLT